MIEVQQLSAVISNLRDLTTRRLAIALLVPPLVLSFITRGLVKLSKAP